MGTDREFIKLTVLEENGVAKTIPEVQAFPWRKLQNIDSIKTGPGLKVRIEGVEFTVAETMENIEALRDLANTAEELEGMVTLGADALGSLIGDGLDLAVTREYYVEVDTATDATAEAVDLPIATVGKVLVLFNNTAVALEIFPVVGENINGAVDDAVYDQAIYTRITFYCKVVGEWIICDDFTGIV